MKLEVEEARRAIESRCAGPLGMETIDVALGIVEIANTAMVNALRRVSVQRGYDPRDFVLVAFGGAGPVHANRLAVELEIPTTIMPMSPGIFSAMGLLVTDLKHDYSNTLLQRADSLDFSRLEELYGGMEAQGRDALLREGVGLAEVSFLRQVDMRYVGQSYELPIPLADARMEPEQLAQLLGRFHQEHERAYGFNAPEEPIEVVALRLTAVGNIAKPRLREVPPGGDDIVPARRTIRPVYFAESDGFVDCAIYDRYRLGAGQAVPGPAVIEEMDSTTVVHPGFQVEVDTFGNLLLTRTKPAR
jgi:N-methylhydantoinase A